MAKQVLFMDYTANLGRKLLLKTHPVPPIMEKKWRETLPLSYKLKWLNVWDSDKIKKEVGLIWAVWHKGIEVNM